MNGSHRATTGLAYRVDGRGDPVLLLNGGLMTIASWEGVAGVLAGRYRVIRFDFRGQLRSPGVPPPNLDAHVADVVALLDQLGVREAHLVGTSFGGQVALLLAATHPHRVRSLVAATVVDFAPPSMLAACRALEAPAARGDGGAMWDTMVSVVYSPAFAAAQREELARRREGFLTLPLPFFAGGVAILQAIAAMDLRPALPAIRCPTLVIAAESDGLMPAERTRAVADAIPGARLVVVGDSGHALVVEKQDEFVRTVVKFLQESCTNAVVGSR